MNILDVNVTTRGKAIEKQMCKDKKPKKTKSVVVGKRRTIKEVYGGDNSTYSENIDLDKRAIHIHGRMEHNLVEHTKYYSCGSTKISKGR